MAMLVLSLMQSSASCWAPCFAAARKALTQHKGKSAAEMAQEGVLLLSVEIGATMRPVHQAGSSCVLFTDAMIYTEELCDFREAIRLVF